MQDSQYSAQRIGEYCELSPEDCRVRLAKHLATRSTNPRERGRYIIDLHIRQPPRLATIRWQAQDASAGGQ